MTALPLLLLVALAAYLVGAIPFGYVVARARGVDILQQGSRNIGATNVWRTVGKPWGVLVFLLDFAKGAVPVWLAGLLPEPSDVALPTGTLPVLAGVSAFLGHLFPIYLGFRGGKGVATGAGVIAILTPFLTLLVVAAWAVVLLSTRIMSLASLTAAAALFVLRLVLTEGPWSADELVVTLFCAFASALVIVRHHGNIRRLLAGKESRL